MNARQKRTAATVAVASGSAALLIGLGALGAVAVLNTTEEAQPEYTWEANGGELGEAVFVEFVRNTSGTGKSAAQIVEDVQEVCREFAADKPTDKMVKEAQAQGDYAIAILAGSTNFYCVEYEGRFQ